MVLLSNLKSIVMYQIVPRETIWFFKYTNVSRETEVISYSFVSRETKYNLIIIVKNVSCETILF